MTDHSNIDEQKKDSQEDWRVLHNKKLRVKPQKSGNNKNHPKKGVKIKVEPIRNKKVIATIKSNLSSSLRDLALFTLGINTAYRANELLSLRIVDVKHLRAGDVLEIRQTKTNKDRSVVLNGQTVDALQNWINSTYLDEQAPLFTSRKGGALQVPTLNNMVKKWCRDAGLVGNYGSHSLRKTWGYWQRKGNNTPLPLLMVAFGHSTERQTLEYLCIQSDEITELYNYEI